MEGGRSKILFFLASITFFRWSEGINSEDSKNSTLCTNENQDKNYVSHEDSTSQESSANTNVDNCTRAMKTMRLNFT